MTVSNRFKEDKVFLLSVHKNIKGIKEISEEKKFT